MKSKNLNILFCLLVLFFSQAQAQIKISTASFYTFGSFSGNRNDSDEYSLFSTVVLPNYSFLVLGYDLLKYPNYEQNSFAGNYEKSFGNLSASVSYFWLNSPKSQRVNAFSGEIFWKNHYLFELGGSFHQAEMREFTVYQAGAGYVFDFNYFPHTFKVNFIDSPYNFMTCFFYSSFYEKNGFGLKWEFSAGEKQFFIDTQNLILDNRENLEKYSVKFEPYYSYEGKIKILFSYKFKKFNDFTINYNTIGVKISL